MYTSHFICHLTDWKKQKFNKIFGTNLLLTFLLAPSKIILKNLKNSYALLYGRDVISDQYNKKTDLKPFQLLKSLIMNILISLGAIFLVPLWKNSISYSVESFKWSIRNSHLYISGRPSSFQHIKQFFGKYILDTHIISRFKKNKEKQGYGDDPEFILKTPLYVLKIHAAGFRYKNRRVGYQAN